MWIPPGFAHGFVTLEDQTIFSYKCTGFYNHDSEQVISWNDPNIGIEWMINNPVLSERDINGIHFNNFISPFTYK